MARSFAQRQAEFWWLVQRTEGCWLWQGGFATTGYGLFTVDGHQDYVHRIAYRALVGPIPDGLQLDHLCRNKACVNPAHLEPVTGVENRRRGRVSLGLDQHCRYGHPWTPENTYLRLNGRRMCRSCSRIRDRRRVRRAA